MNIKKVVKELRQKYPNKKIILDSKDNPAELIVELEPTSDHPDKSLALAVVGKSKAHYHNKTTEIYEPIKGKLIVSINDRKHILGVGDRIKIEPQQILSAEGKETWFLTYSTPGWTFGDHIIVDN